MKVTYPGPLPLVRLNVEGEQVTCEAGAQIDVPKHVADQLIAQGWETQPTKKGADQ